MGDLIAALSSHDPATPVRIAKDCGEFMDYTVGRVVLTPGDNAGDQSSDVPVVHIGTGDSSDYLPAAVASALGWRSSC